MAPSDGIEDECAREPIHAPGAIQPHGVLLVIDASNGQILQASANAAVLFQVPMAEILGESWRRFIRCATDPESVVLANPSATRIPYARMLLPTIVQGRLRYSGVWHLTSARWLLEIESQADRADRDTGEFRRLVRQLEDAADIEEVTATAATGFRRILGYDHVMVYQFADNGGGAVIAEDVRVDLAGFRGLRFPASDIPSQARSLYLRTRVRAIVDIRYAPAPLIPVLDPLTGHATDLSDVSLRSVSPIHVEYVINMGVTATLVVSVVVNGALWGLIACHHQTARRPDYELRDDADVLGRALAARIGVLERERDIALDSQLLAARELVISQFDGSAVAAARLIRDHAAELLAMTRADGVAILTRNDVSSAGSTPDAVALLDIRRQLTGSCALSLAGSAERVRHTDSLREAFTDCAGALGACAGMLLVFLGEGADAAIVWTRDGFDRKVVWGGNPYLLKTRNAEGRLSPRNSFDAWQETVRGHSEPWERQFLESGRVLALLSRHRMRASPQPDARLLLSTFRGMREAMIIIGVGSMDDPVSVLHFNEAFQQATGVDAPTVVRGWQLDQESVRRHLDASRPFRTAYEAPDDALRGPLILELQPIGVIDNLHVWVGLLQRASAALISD